MQEQEVLLDEFAEPFAACEEINEFFRAHRAAERTRTAASLVATWTTARSYRTFLTVVHLCKCGYGQQAAMLNRTLFEDMVSAHWAIKHPEVAVQRMTEHDQYTATLRGEEYTKHGINRPSATKLPSYSEESARSWTSATATARLLGLARPCPEWFERLSQCGLRPTVVC